MFFYSDLDPVIRLQDCDIQSPTDISIVLKSLVADVEDAVRQFDVLNEIISTSFIDHATAKKFDNMPVCRLKLSLLKTLYNDDDKRVLNLFSGCHMIYIDSHFHLPFGTDQISMDTS